MSIALGDRCAAIKHGVTRFRITLECYRAEYLSGAIPEGNSPDARWVPLVELDHYPLNATARRLARLLQEGRRTRDECGMMNDERKS